MNGFFTGLELQLKGKPIGHWLERSVPVSKPAINRGPKTSLYSFLAQHEIGELLILGTETAIGDVMGALNKGATNPTEIQTDIIRVNNADVMFSDIDLLSLEGIGAIAFVRGGDDGTLMIWDDNTLVSQLVDLGLPFYVALGHTHSITLADKIADGQFNTPTDFGHQIGEVLARQESDRHRDEEFFAKELKIKSLQQSTKGETPLTTVKALAGVIVVLICVVGFLKRLFC